jgi:hypothetical protein
MRLFRLHPLLITTAALMAALTVVCVGGLIVDNRTLLGIPIWIKPTKFSISIAIYSVTIAWLISLLERRHRLGRVLGNVIAVALLAEMIVIVGQVVRGRRSHFNVSTSLDATLWSVMAASIVILWLATAGLAILLLRQRISDRANAMAVRLGMLVALAGLAEGFLMTSPTTAQLQAMKTAPPTFVGGHSVGVDDGGPGLAFVNWSTTGGDLRIGHFIGMHALQALPLVALGLVLLSRRVTRLADVAVRTRLILVAGLGWAGLTTLVTWQALRGQSIVHPDGLTLGAAAALVALVGAGVTWALRAPVTPPADRVAVPA